MDVADAGSTVTLFDNGSATALGTATVGSDGSWSTGVTLSGNGSHSIVARDTDAAGNTGSSSAVVYTLTVTPNGWANPNGGNWNVAANWSSGAVPLNTADVSINPIGTAPYVVTIAPSTAVSANSLTLDDPDVTLLDEGALTIAASLLMTAGAVEIENGGTLSLGGSPSLTADFAGTGGNLILGTSPGFTGTINAISTADGAVTITGSGNVTTTSGDAIDLSASGGTQANPSNLTLGLLGAITGAAVGIDVVQNGVGNIAIATAGPVVGEAGQGILAEESATGVGSILIDGSGNVTSVGAGVQRHCGREPQRRERKQHNRQPDRQYHRRIRWNTRADGWHRQRSRDCQSGDGRKSLYHHWHQSLWHRGRIEFHRKHFRHNQRERLHRLGKRRDRRLQSGDVHSAAGRRNHQQHHRHGRRHHRLQVSCSPAAVRGRPAFWRVTEAAPPTRRTPPFLAMSPSTTPPISLPLGGDGIRAYTYGSGNVTVQDLAGTTIAASDEFGIIASSYGSRQRFDLYCCGRHHQLRCFRSGGGQSRDGDCCGSGFERQA